MSYNNSRVSGRGQNRGGRGKSGGGGAHQPVSSINNSFKKSSIGQGGQSRVIPASLGSENSANSATAVPKVVQNGTHVQPSTQGPSKSQAHPEAQTPKPSTAALDSAAPSTPIKAESTKPFALQFGTISPGVINGLQIPARTSSAPPNLDEQKRAQARQAALRAVPPQPIAPNNTKQLQPPLPPPPRSDPIAISQPSTGVNSKIATTPPVASTSVHPPPTSTLPIQGICLPMAFQQPPVSIQFGAPGPQQIPMMNGPHPQQMFFHNLQPHPMQLPPIMHQNFQMAPQLGKFGLSGIPTPQFTQQQQLGKFTTPPRKSNAVKITHPETHEEFRLDKRTDNNNSNVNMSSAHYRPQFSQHQPPSFLNVTSVAMHLGAQNQRLQVGQSGQPISHLGPSGPTQGSVKPNVVQVGQTPVGPTVTVTKTEKPKSRESSLSALALTEVEVPKTSAVSGSGVVESDSTREEPIRRSDFLKKSREKQEEQAIESTPATATNLCAVNIFMDSSVGAATTGKLITGFESTHELPMENVLPTTIDLPFNTEARYVEAVESKALSCSVTKIDESRANDSNSANNASMDVDGRNKIPKEPEHVKSEVSEAAILDNAYAKIYPVPTVSESSQDTKLVLVKDEESEVIGSEKRINLNDMKNELETISNHDVNKSSATSGAKDKITLESTKVKPNAGKKKKRRDILSKADAAGSSDLYNAYKNPENRPQVLDSLESTKSSPTIDEKNEKTDDSNKSKVIVEEDTEIKSELDDWEDVVDATTSDNIVLIEAKDTKKYTRDFLLTFSEQCTHLPFNFVIGSDLADALMSIASHAVNPIPGRSPGVTRGDRRGNNMVGDDRWTKAANSLPLRDVRNDANYGVSRNLRGQPINQYYPILNNPMPQVVLPHGGLMRNNSDNDRWRSINSSRGLMPYPPPMPSQIMHKAEKRYVVGKVSDEEQAKQRQLKGILNKLTPQNFEILFQQVSDVNIDNTVTLSGVIAQIFDKALMEPTFCEMYADFCYHLSDVLPDFTENGEKITFKRLLLNKCQEEFERGEREQAEANRVEEEGDAIQTKEEREEKRIKARRRMLGNIRLIGELFKKKMLTERIMHECIQKLLGEYENPDEEDLESLCKLMATIGNQIDHFRAKVYMDAYFDAIVKLSTNQNLSSRVRFMLRDVIDLRKNKWQQRRKVEGPKKIEDVHKDAAQERISQTNRLSRGPSLNSNQRRGPPGDYSPRISSVLPSPTSQFGSIHGFPDQAHGYGLQDARLEERLSFENRPISFPSSQRPFDDNLITLGPQGGLARGMSLRGQPLISSPNGNIATIDRMNTQLREGFSLGSVPNKVSYQENLQDLNVTAGNQGIRGLMPAEQTLGPFPSEVKPLSEGILKERSMATLREFYSIKDEGEVALRIRELNTPAFHPSIVSLWVTDSFERKDRERDLLAKLLVNLCNPQHRVFNQIQLIQGFESVLSLLEDAVNDAPRAAEFLGCIFVNIILENVVPLRDVGRIIREGGEEPGRLLETGLASEVLGSILEIIKIEKGESIVNEIIASSDLRLEEFRAPHPMNSKKLDAFI